uniref:VWFA domain-containing protein n=1 Tax=Alexandrium catenella TaxID=2925 RepID=A0A7S1WA04_ALECA
MDLAKQALLGLFGQLRADDRFGLATFNAAGTVVQALQLVGELDGGAVQASVNGLAHGGGTTLQAGMDAAIGICKGAKEVDGPRHKRLLFLTDMHDLGSEGMNAMIESQANQGLYVSFICIGMEFNSQLAEEVTKHCGANYFCITRDEELRKVVVDDFDFNFFPAAFEVEVAQQSDAFDLVSVYGTPYDTREEASSEEWHPSTHRFYPSEFKDQAKELMLCAGRYSGSLPSPALQQLFTFLSPSARSIIRVDTVFPSAVAQDGSIEGGLVLLRLRPRNPESGSGTVRLMTRYISAAGGGELSTTVDVRIPEPAGADAEPDPAVVKGVLLQRYVEVCRVYLALAERPSEEHAAELRAALAGVQALLAEFDAAPERVDGLCPGVREELRGFAGMVQEHFAKLEGAPTP